MPQSIFRLILSWLFLLYYFLTLQAIKVPQEILPYFIQSAALQFPLKTTHFDSSFVSFPLWPQDLVLHTEYRVSYYGAAILCSMLRFQVPLYQVGRFYAPRFYAPRLAFKHHCINLGFTIAVIVLHTSLSLLLLHSHTHCKCSSSEIFFLLLHQSCFHFSSVSTFASKTFCLIRSKSAGKQLSNTRIKHVLQDAET